MAYKVIQWGIGNVGKESMEVIIENPDLELVGVWKHSATGTEQDVGALYGLDVDTGIKATTSKEDLIALDADCVLYMPRLTDLDDVCALLASGKNVVCTPFAFFAASYPEQDQAKLRAACEKGNSSLYGTGINPGFAGMIQPLALSGMSKKIKKVTVYERANWSFYDNAAITFDNMRFGHPKAEATLAANPFAQFNSDIFVEQLYMMAAAWGMEFDEVKVQQDLIETDEAFDIICGHVDAGTVCGQRYQWQGIYQGEVVIEIDALWNIGDDYPSHWPVPADGWTVNIEGSPSMQTHFLCCASFDPGSTATLEDHVHSTEIATAMLAVNSVKSVCDAPQGLLSASDILPARPYRPFAQA